MTDSQTSNVIVITPQKTESKSLAQQTMESSMVRDSILLIVAAIIVLVGNYVKDNIINRLYKRKFNSKKLNLEVARDSSIYSILGQMQEKYKSDRSFICILHNGDSFINGIDMNKFTRLYEVCRLGVEETVTSNHAILFNGMPDLVKIIVDSDNSPLIIHVDNMQHSLFKSRLIQKGTKIFAVKTLRQGNRIFGYCGIEYCWEFDGKIDCEQLLEFGSQLESLLGDKSNCLVCGKSGSGCLFCKLFN